jgi:tryptophan halogenase
MNGKIAVIGSGNAGVISSLMSLFSLWDFADSHDYPELKTVEITVFHDPKIKREIVGQGTTISVSNAIRKVLKVDERLNNPAGITPKVGFFYKNWARKNNELLYKLGGGAMSYHYDPGLLRDTFLKSDIVNFVEGNFEPKDIPEEYDVVFDCRGKTANDWNEYDMVESPVNCCLLGRVDCPRGPEVWTENIATPDGWCFKIPLVNGYSYGYVFNDKITSIEEAKINFEKLFNVKTLNVVPFNNYIAKNFTDDNRIFKNGNRLFFFEPLESTATPMYGNFIYDMLSGICQNTERIEHNKSVYREKIYEVHDWILWHYFYGSRYNTKFWKYAQELSRSHKYSQKFLERVKYVRDTCDYKTFTEQEDFPEDLQGEFAYVDYCEWFFNNN